MIAAVRPLLAPAELIDQRWLADGVAWQGLVVTRAPGEQALLRARLGAALAPRPIDINLVAADAARRRKSCSLPTWNRPSSSRSAWTSWPRVSVWDERISEITLRAMRGELAFEAALKERVALLKGLDAAILEDIYASRVTVMPGAATLVATMRRHGAHCALVSGGFSFFSERIAARLQFDSQQANTLEIVDGKLAGSARQPILGREAKLASLESPDARVAPRCERHRHVGDGANDLSMLRAAGLGVAFRAKPILAAAAAVRIEASAILQRSFICRATPATSSIAAVPVEAARLGQHPPSGA